MELTKPPVCLTVSCLANRSLFKPWLINLAYEPKVKVWSHVSPPPGSAAPPPLPPSACSPHETLPINYFPPPDNELTAWLPPTGNSITRHTQLSFRFSKVKARSAKGTLSMWRVILNSYFWMMRFDFYGNENQNKKARNPLKSTSVLSHFSLLWCIFNF